MAITDIAGAVEARRNRRTGTLVVLIDGLKPGGNWAHDPDPVMGDGLRWATLCDDHGSIVLHQTRSDAAGFLACPDEFCEPCRGKLDGFPQTEAEAKVCEHGVRYWFGHECGDCMDGEA